MKPEKREIDYERLSTDDFLVGEIVEIQRDKEHKSVFQGQEKVSDCIRFKFSVEGYKFPHYSRWMTFSYGEKTNLYNKYLTALVEGASPDCDFDLDHLKGMKVKMLWTEKNSFQSLETIRPVNGKIKYSPEPEPEIEITDEIPF